MTAINLTAERKKWSLDSVQRQVYGKTDLSLTENQLTLRVTPIPPVQIWLLSNLFSSVIFSTTKNGCIMEQNEGNVFVEYSLITVLISVGVALMLNGASQQITNIWNMIAAFVIK